MSQLNITEIQNNEAHGAADWAVAGGGLVAGLASLQLALPSVQLVANSLER